MQLFPKPQRHSQTSSNELASAKLKVLPKLDMSPQVIRQSLPVAERQRVVILVDGSNLFYAALQLGIEIDYTKLLRRLTNNRVLVRAYFYTGVDRQNDRQQNFLHWLRRNGYRVIDKELIQFPDGSQKANLEVEMAIDMMRLTEYCDRFVLLSGNGGLTYAVNAVSYRGAQIEVVSLRSMTNDELINVADTYVDLEQIRESIQRVSA